MSKFINTKSKILRTFSYLVSGRVTCLEGERIKQKKNLYFLKLTNIRSFLGKVVDYIVTC